MLTCSGFSYFPHNFLCCGASALVGTVSSEVVCGQRFYTSDSSGQGPVQWCTAPTER